MTERERIVAWLRKGAFDCRVKIALQNSKLTNEVLVLSAASYDAIAKAIERGDHLKEKKGE